MESIVVIPNFLNTVAFNTLKSIILSPQFNWSYQDHITYNYNHLDERSDPDQYQFTNTMYIDHEKVDQYTYDNIVQPLIRQLNIFALIRVKANLTGKRDKPITSGLHIDDQDFFENKIPFTTAVLYLNTNNGFTSIIDQNNNQHDIPSVANTLVMFAGCLHHNGTSSTDTRRVVLNLNFINQQTQQLYKNIK